LSGEQFEDIVSALDVKGLCNRSDIEILFRVSESDSSQTLFFVFCNAVLKSAPPNSGSESSFHSFWDTNIRDILELLIPNGTNIRDSSAHTSTKKSRPDYGFVLDNICPFHGEEKAPTDRDDPKAELSDKLMTLRRTYLVRLLLSISLHKIFLTIFFTLRLSLRWAQFDTFRDLAVVLAVGKTLCS
jgi:hypothetical protein